MSEPAKKTWRDKIVQYNKKNGFQFVGWNKQGVPKWRGGWTKGPPLWFCRMFLAFAITLLTAGILTGLFTSGGETAEAGWALSFAGMIHSLAAALMYRHRRNLQSLLSVEKVSERLGVDAETLWKIATEKGIQPRTVINEEPLWNLQDFGDVGTLLRAAEAPVSADTLLRAAEPTPSSEPQEELLRASSAETKRETIKTPMDEVPPATQVVLGGGRTE